MSHASARMVEPIQNGKSGPGALLCAWIHVAAEHQSEFRDFHDREHMFERVDIPGFDRGRRFGAVSASSDFLILYEVDELATLASEPYLARLNAPTAWTLRSIPLVRRANIANLELSYSRGRARGGAVLCIRFDSANISPWNKGLLELFDRLLLLPGVLSIHAGTSDEHSSNIETAESVAGGRTGTWERQALQQVFVIEADSIDILTRLLASELTGQKLLSYGVERLIDVGTYGLQICVDSARHPTSACLGGQRTR